MPEDKPKDKPARKALPNARITTSGGNNPPSMASEANSQDVNNDPIVVSAAPANTTMSAPNSNKKKSQASKSKESLGGSSSRKRDHHSMANASPHAKDAGESMAAQPASTNQAHTNDESLQPNKYQRILPNEPGHRNDHAAAQAPAYLPVGLAHHQIEDAYRRFEQLRANNTPANDPELSKIQNLLAAARQYSQFRRQQQHGTQPGVQASNNPANNPALIQLGKNEILRPVIGTVPGPTTDLAEELAYQIHAYMDLHRLNEQARQAQSQDLQALHRRADASRDCESASIHFLFIKREEELRKKENQATTGTGNQRTSAGPASDL